MRKTTDFLSLCLLAIICLVSAMPGHVMAETVTIKQGDDRLRVLIDGELFTEYIFRGYSRPILFPINGPHGLGVTRSFPIKAGVPGEAPDHPHQKPMLLSLSVALSAVCCFNPVCQRIEFQLFTPDLCSIDCVCFFFGGTLLPR